jgi:hypothetical protein
MSGTYCSNLFYLVNFRYYCCLFIPLDNFQPDRERPLIDTNEGETRCTIFRRGGERERDVVGVRLIMEITREEDFTMKPAATCKAVISSREGDV